MKYNIEAEPIIVTDEEVSYRLEADKEFFMNIYRKSLLLNKDKGEECSKEWVYYGEVIIKNYNYRNIDINKVEVEFTVYDNHNERGYRYGYNIKVNDIQKEFLIKVWENSSFYRSFSF